MPEYGTWTQKQRVAKAKELLKEAGFDASHPLKFTLLYNTSENHKKLATAVQSMWKKSWAWISVLKTKNGKLS